jgi:preprotein translocase subunit SecB
MEAKKSELELINFYLLEHQFFTVNPDNQAKFTDEEIVSIFNQYPIDIDFIHKDIDEHTFQAHVKVGINHKQQQFAGYSIQITGVGIFKLDNAMFEANEVAYKNLKHFSTVNIVVNNLRNVISVQSAFSPWGRYNLPAIDISDLFKQKIKQQEKQKKK